MNVKLHGVAIVGLIDLVVPSKARDQAIKTRLDVQRRGRELTTSV
jgi:hypothetical protein